MIEARVHGTLRGTPIKHDAGCRAAHATAQVATRTRGGLAVDVNVTAYGAQGVALLRLSDGDGVEVSGTIELSVRLDAKDDAHFVFDLTAWAIRRIGRAPEVTEIPQEGIRRVL